MKTLNQKNKQIEKQPLEYYLNLQYPVTLYPASEGGYVAQIKDLPGCLTQGETLEEAIANINEAREFWIETAYEAGDEEYGKAIGLTNIFSRKQILFSNDFSKS